MNNYERIYFKGQDKANEQNVDPQAFTKLIRAAAAVQESQPGTPSSQDQELNRRLENAADKITKNRQ